MPDPLPINLPIRRKQQIRFECIRVMQNRALSIAFVPDTSFADSEYSYVYAHTHVFVCLLYLCSTCVVF